MAHSDNPKLQKQQEDIDVAKTNAFHNEEVIEAIDHEQTTWQCLAQNPKIILWSLFANRKLLRSPPLLDLRINIIYLVGICLVGYENLVLSVCLAMPAFQ
jgi:hypothetical protein